MNRIALNPRQLNMPFLQKCAPFFHNTMGMFSEISLLKNSLLGKTVFISMVKIRNSERLGKDGSMGQGASFDRTRACSRALGEAIERTSSTWRKTENDLYGSYDSLSKKYDLLDPVTFPQRENKEYLLPLMSLPSQQSCLSWTLATEITQINQNNKYVPSYMVYMPHKLENGEAWLDFSTSTGLAAGASKEQAEISAILELIERDAFSLFWLFFRQSASLPSDLFHKLSSEFECLSQGVVLHDITTDLGIPVVLATFFGTTPEQPRLVVGAGAAFSLEMAAVKAIEEFAGCLNYGKYLLDSKKPPIVSPQEIEDFNGHAHYCNRYA